jgi:hypothetical protein
VETLALEILGMAAIRAQHGISTVHFYWIAARPARPTARSRDERLCWSTTARRRTAGRSAPV